MPRRKPKTPPMCSCGKRPARKGHGWWRECKECTAAREARRNALEATRHTDQCNAAKVLAGVPLRYKDARLTDFKGIDSITVDLSAGFRLFGKPRMGETHFLAGLAHTVIEQRHSCRFWNVPELLDTLRTELTIGRGNQTAFEQACKVEVLLLDDMTACRMTDYATERLYLIVNHRYNCLQHTSVTGNDWNKVDPRLAGRIAETTTEVSL